MSASILIHLAFLSISNSTIPFPCCIFSFNPYSPGFSIYFINRKLSQSTLKRCFNPYSPGFSIYFNNHGNDQKNENKLQSLFTWIFYLFEQKKELEKVEAIASILIHLDFLSIYNILSRHGRRNDGFNPYSPGFSIYLIVTSSAVVGSSQASILIHLDFLSI